MKTDRRSLITGAAALTAFNALPRNARATGGAVVPPLTLGRAQQIVRQPQASVAIANAPLSMQDQIVNDTTSNSLNSRRLCYAPTKSDITDIVLAFPGFGWYNNAEANFPVNYTVTASVEYPIGSTPHQVFFGGATSATVTAGRTLVKSDPYPVTIPAGAQFAVKCYATWTAGNFWLGSLVASSQTNEWTTRGTSLTDNTLNTTALTSTSNVAGFSPIVYATLKNPTAVVGLVGDSIGTLTADWTNTHSFGIGWGRALRNAIPFLNTAVGGDALSNYLSRPEGRGLLLRNAITHCIMEMGGNDLFGGASLTTMQGYFQSAVTPFLDRGVKCYGVTFTPRTTSSDGWLTATNQTLVSSAVETVRQGYNTWMRTNWQSLGLSGYFDLAHAVDPTDSGKWSFDSGAAYAVSAPGAGDATLSNGVVQSISPYFYNSNNSLGAGYPTTGVTIPCVIYPYPNMGGSGAAANGIANSGQSFLNNFTVTAGGSGYGYPPMVTTQGTWTGDGVHPNGRGVNEIIYRCGSTSSFGTVLAPETFVL